MVEGCHGNFSNTVERFYYNIACHLRTLAPPPAATTAST
jgi:hypothetical protein